MKERPFLHGWNQNSSIKGRQRWVSLIKGRFKATSFSNIGHSKVLDIFFATERGLLDLNSIQSKHQMQTDQMKTATKNLM